MTSSTLIELESWLIYQCMIADRAKCNSMADMAVRAQKKLLPRVGALALDESASALLDRLSAAAGRAAGAGGRAAAERAVRAATKTAVKLAVLRRHKQLSRADGDALAACRDKLNLALMAVISFHEVEFTYDRNYIIDTLNAAHQHLRPVLQHHLTEKSVLRADSSFAFFTDPKMLDSMFTNTEDPKALRDLSALVSQLRRAMDTGLL